MLWAIASSVFVIYLYRNLNAVADVAPPGTISPDGIAAEIAALNAQIAALESKIAGAGGGSVTP